MKWRPKIDNRKLIGIAGLVIGIAAVSVRAEWTPADHQNGYVVFAYTTMANLAPTHVPETDAVAKTMACTLAPGEYESLQFGVHAIADGIQNVSVQVECDLPVTIYHRISPAIKEQLAFRPADAGEVQGWLLSEIHLQRGNVFTTLPKGESVNFWLTFRAETDAAAGLHRGKIRIQPAGKSETVIDLAVTVRRFKLERPRASFCMWFREDMLPKRLGGIGASKETVLGIYRDMAAHGQNACVFYPATSFHPLPPRNNHVLDKLLPLAMEAELLDANVMSLIVGSIASDNSLDELKASIAWLLAESRKRGWPELAGFAADEPHYPHDLVSVRQTCAGYRGLDMRMSVDLSNIVSLYGYSIPNLCDVQCVAEGLVTPEASAEAKRMGTDIMIYSYTIWREGFDPLKERFFAGFFTWTHHLQGNWIWAYHHEKHRHAWFPPGSEEPMPVTGWEARREGVDDYRYMQMLEDSIAANDARPLAVEAAAWVAGLRDRLGRVQPLEVMDGNPLAAEEFDAIRERAANYIGRLGAVPNSAVKRRPPSRGKDEAAIYRGMPVGACIAGLTHADPVNRRAAAWALYEQGARAGAASGPLSRLLSDPEVRMPALHALEAIGPGAHPAIPEIAKLLAHPDPFVRIGATMTLGAIGCPIEKYERGSPRVPSAHAPKIIAPLAVALEDPYPDVSERVAEILRVTGPFVQPAMPAISRALDNPSPTVRRATMGLITGVGVHAAPVAAKLVKIHAENPGNAGIINAIAAIGPAGADALPVLREYATRPNPDTTHADSYYAIFRIREAPEDLSNMIALLKDPGVRADTKNHMVNRLVDLGGEAAAVADELRELTKAGEFTDKQKESGFGLTSPEKARYIDGVKCRDYVPKLKLAARLPLDGWRFQPDPKGIGIAQGFYKPEFPSDDLPTIRIGEFWDDQGYKNLGEGWYRLQFKCPELPAGKRVFMLFEAVDEAAFLYIDGKRVAWYDTASPDITWSKPFLLDVTGSLQSGGDHLLAVRVHSYSGAGGLYKPVNLMVEK